MLIFLFKHLQPCGEAHKKYQGPIPHEIQEDKPNKCTSLYRFDLASYGCVHDSLSLDYGVDCNETELAETLRREEVGHGLLAYLNFSYCGE